MRLLWGALRAEGRKAWASPVAWSTALAVLLFPLVGAGFMLLVRDPEGARALGIIGTKARLSGLSADWPAYLGFLSQAMAAGYLFLQALFVSWLFGREWSDGTLKLLLAVPVGRTRVVVAKFLVTLVWGGLALTLMGATGLAWGSMLGLPTAAPEVIVQAMARFALGGFLTLLLGTGTALFASWGRGFLVPLSWTLFTLVLAQLGSALGWAAVVPWAIPAVATGIAGPEGLDVGGLVIVLATSGLGVGLTLWFWNRADHPR